MNTKTTEKINATADVEYRREYVNFTTHTEPVIYLETVTGEFTKSGNWYVLPNGKRKRADKVKIKKIYKTGDFCALKNWEG